ncbi:uncharacterized protein CMC5_084250 [Chondromyces crocatus]|uniref:Uncharacterized protein n=2 Tax=Chondromyces crocatus TaxID=52 RepID=A0A0K1ETD7_CHOCO|nr:uncharacterized protein CMC5_084250 [Chondromyces crocatus]
MHMNSAWMLRLASGLALFVATACGGIVVVDHDLGGGEGGAGGFPSGTTGSGAGTPTSSASTGGGGPGTGGGLPGEAVPEPIQQRCPDLAAQPVVCVTTAYKGVAVVSPATGQHCHLFDFLDGDLQAAWKNSSIGVLGNHLYFPQGERGAARISLDLGVIEPATMSRGVTAITTWQGSLLVRPYDSFESNLERYATFDDLRAGSVAEVFQVNNDNLFVFAASRTSLFSAWHSTSFIEREPIPAFDSIATIALQNFDGWVDGLWPNDTDGTLIVLSDRILYTFEQTTGAQVGRAPVSSGLGQLMGLACWRN